MRRLATLSVFLLCLISLKSQVVEVKDSLALFIRNNPHSKVLNVLNEGTRLFLSASDDDILVCLSVANPMVQMRLIMMPTSIYIDPSGKKKEKYEIRLPSALDIKDDMELMRLEGGEAPIPQERPDILPLIRMLNVSGARFMLKGKSSLIGTQRFHIELDIDNELINYYILLPKRLLMSDKKLRSVWSIGLCSCIDVENPPALGGMPVISPLQEESNSSDDINVILQNDISCWLTFSIDEINNLNIK